MMTRRDWVPEETDILRCYYEDHGWQRVQTELLKQGYNRSRASIICKAGHIRRNKEEPMDLSLTRPLSEDTPDVVRWFAYYRGLESDEIAAVVNRPREVIEELLEVAP